MLPGEMGEIFKVDRARARLSTSRSPASARRTYRFSA